MPTTGLFSITKEDGGLKPKTDPSKPILGLAKLEDFRVLKVLGRGSFGKVCLVEYKINKQLYAMKSLKKDVLIDQDQVENTLLEKNILETLKHPFLVGLQFCFQNSERIYLVMPFLR
jgi:serine/threonine protein kinase